MDLREELSKFEEKSNEEIVKENRLITSFNHYINTKEIEPEDKESLIDIFQECIDKKDFSNCILLNELFDACEVKKGKEINETTNWKTKCTEKINVNYSEFPNLIKLIIKEYEIVNTLNIINSRIDELNLPKLHRDSSLKEFAEACTKAFWTPEKNFQMYSGSAYLSNNVAYLYKIINDLDFIETKAIMIYLYMVKMTKQNNEGFILFKGEVQSLLDRFDMRGYTCNINRVSYDNEKIINQLIRDGEKLSITCIKFENDKYGIKCDRFDKNNYYFTLKEEEEKAKEIFENRIKVYSQKELIGKVLFDTAYKKIVKNINNDIKFTATEILKEFNLDAVVVNEGGIYLSKENYYMICRQNEITYYQANLLDNFLEEEENKDYEIDMSDLLLKPKNTPHQKNVMGNAMLGAMIAGSTGAIIGASTAIDYNNRNANTDIQERKLIRKIRERVKYIKYYDSIAARKDFITSCHIARNGKEDFPSWITTVSTMLSNAINSEIDKNVIEFILQYKNFDKEKYKEHISNKFWKVHKEEKFKYEQEIKNVNEEMILIQEQIDSLVEEEKNVKESKIRENVVTTELHKIIDKLKELYKERDSLGMFALSRKKEIEKQIENLNSEKNELSKKSKEKTKEINEKYRKKVETIKEEKNKLFRKYKDAQERAKRYQHYIDCNIIK